MDNPFANGAFVLGGEPETIKRGDKVFRNDVVPFINEPKAWEQYHNTVLYDAEVTLRNWIKEMSKDPKWYGSHKNRRYMFSQLFEILFGRPYENSDAKYIRQLTDLFSYYSSRIQNTFWDKERQKSRTKTNYTISPKRADKPPYSLKLRMEWFDEQGIKMTEYNMRLYERDLKPGHARNPRTNANMEKRSEKKREQYREYKRQWNEARKDRT